MSTALPDAPVPVNVTLPRSLRDLGAHHGLIFSQLLTEAVRGALSARGVALPAPLARRRPGPVPAGNSGRSGGSEKSTGGQKKRVRGA